MTRESATTGDRKVRVNMNSSAGTGTTLPPKEEFLQLVLKDDYEALLAIAREADDYLRTVRPKAPYARNLSAVDRLAHLVGRHRKVFLK